MDFTIIFVAMKIKINKSGFIQIKIETVSSHHNFDGLIKVRSDIVG